MNSRLDLEELKEASRLIAKEIQVIMQEKGITKEVLSEEVE